jgi:hypothetical protein
MGICCSENLIIDEIGEIKTFKNFFRFILTELERVQNIIYNYSNDTKLRNIKSIVTIDDNQLLSYEQYEFYIQLNKVLILIKQFCDKYENIEIKKNMNKENKENFNNNFKLSDSKSILKDILKTENDYNLKDLNNISKNIKFKSFFISESEEDNNN